MRQFLSRVFDVYASFKKPILIVFLLLVAIQILSLAGPYYVGMAINGFSLKSFGLISRFAVYWLIAAILRVFVQWIKDDYELDTIDFRVKRALAKKTLDKILTLSVGQLRSEHSGLTHSVINRGEHSLSALAFTFVYEICPIFCQITFVSVALLWMSWQLCGIIFLGATTFLLLTWLINSKFWQGIKEIETKSHLNEKLRNEIIRNVVSVIMFAVGKRVSDDYIDSVRQTNDQAVKLYLRYHVYNFFRNASVVLTQFFILLVGGYYVCADVLKPGELVTFIMWSQMVFGNITNLGAIHKRCIDLAASVSKYFQILDVVPAVRECSEPIIVTSLKGKIELKDVWFKYPTDRYIQDDDDSRDKVADGVDKNLGALCGVDLCINAGEKVAFVGPSGAGKTTLINLIQRAYDPDKGDILIDGVDVRKYGINSYRSLIGCVEQNVSLFDDSLRRNITFGLKDWDKGVTNERLDEIGRTACIDKFYDRLTNGYDTEVGENGIQLSGGERLRVGIARALIKDPCILILDEATASLDMINERLIKLAIDKTSKGRTTIIIAHRLSTVRDADKIFVMDKGRIVGVGKHDELMQNCDIYRTLVETQMYS